MFFLLFFGCLLFCLFVLCAVFRRLVGLVFSSFDFDGCVGTVLVVIGFGICGACLCCLGLGCVSLRGVLLFGGFGLLGSFAYFVYLVWFVFVLDVSKFGVVLLWVLF